MPLVRNTILDFEIEAISEEVYSLTIRERQGDQTSESLKLATTQFSNRVDFLTEFDLERLNVPSRHEAERFDEMHRIGQELYQKLFTPEVESVWNKHRESSAFLVLCLRFSENASVLEILPWETMHDGLEFLAAGEKTTITRLPLEIKAQFEHQPINGPIKLLGFFASPLDLSEHDRLDVEGEKECLLEAINDCAAGSEIFAEFEDEATLESLEQNLSNGYHVLHFTGHGISPRHGGGLVLEDHNGAKRSASIAEVAKAVGAGVKLLRLAVLSSCETARALHSEAFRDLSRELLRLGVPSVVAMQFLISDEGGLHLAECLYKQIIEGVGLERAVHAVRRLLIENPNFRVKNDALGIVLLTADGTCLEAIGTTEQPTKPRSDPSYFGDKLEGAADRFYGRRKEYRQIRDSLTGGQRAVLIKGIGGIGKTAFLEHVIERVYSRFNAVISFDCRRAALSPETILIELHRCLKQHGVQHLQSLIGQVVPLETLAEQISLITSELPILIVFDNFEAQLNERREISSFDLDAFLNALMRSTPTGCQFIFTSRYTFTLGGERSDNLRELPLSELSRAEAVMLMQKLPALAQTSYQDKIALLTKFGCHPYAIVTLDRYVDHRSIDEVLRSFSSLTSHLHEFLAIEVSCSRLSESGRELLNRLSAFRSTVPAEAALWVGGEEVFITIEDVLADRLNLPEELKGLDDDAIRQRLANHTLGVREVRDISVELQELIEWGFVSPSFDGTNLNLSVHSLVREFCRGQMETSVWQAKLHDAAAFYTDRTRLKGIYDKDESVVLGELEAFELLMEAEAFSAAAQVLTTVHPIIGRWGFSRYLELQYRRLADKVDQTSVAAIRNHIGDLLQNRGAYDAALEQYQLSLAIWEQVGSRDMSANVLKEIGNVLDRRGQYEDALQMYQSALGICEELEDSEGIADVTHQIAKVHRMRGNYDEALTHHQRWLQICQERDDKSGVASVLGDIGAIYYFQGKYEAALQQYELSKKISEDLVDVAGVARALNLIGAVHQKCADFEMALKVYESCLRIYEDIDDREGIAGILHNIAVIEQNNGDYHSALRRFRLSLDISEQLGDLQGIARSLKQVGDVLSELGRYSEAFEPLFFALAAMNEMDSAEIVFTGQSLKNLRDKWGNDHFDSSWRLKTGEAVPDWFE